MTSSEPSEPSENSRKGRRFSEVWDGHMIKGAQKSRGHYAASCSYCNSYWNNGKPHVLREHLANHCRKCPKEVSIQFAKIVGKIAENKEKDDDDDDDDDESDSESMLNPAKKQKLNNGQTSIRSFYKNEKLEKGYCDEIERSITKAFVMCNIPFSTIENPWFIDLIKTLQPGFDPPTKQVLSGTFLEAETSRVNIRVMNKLTIALDGWTDPKGNSIWAFMLMTGSRQEYLLCLEDLSNIRHTGEHLSKVIEEVIGKVKYIVRCANILTKYFKNSTLGSSWLNEVIKNKNIEGGGIATFFKQMLMDDYRSLKNSCIKVFNKRYEEFNENIYLLAFFLYPQYKGTIFKYLDKKTPYSAPYSNNNGPFQWWNSIIDGRSSLSRLAKIIFSITPHSASCERLFSALGWMFDERRTNLSTKTIECMAKIYTHNVSLSNNTLFKERDILNENEDEEEYEELPNVQEENIDEVLNIDQVIDLGLWVYIESTKIPLMFNNKYGCENDDDWDLEEIV
ncbi:ribonuclease H-like domain-containing protein [Rhizophagus clarus]|uniref:Ribonuclease H-like domain-containing protein n=1 Tax=Rhizophagus clarus TaxID=94130 RepID=A0A8H3M7C4_9GLOM|nr:ribonuclease H-like domain-containing protein [Rhizophagus clarus]